MAGTDEHVYTPAQAAVITGLSVPAVHKAIEHKVIRPKRVRRGRVIKRMLSKPQMVYLRVEATGAKALPLAARRRIARLIEREPATDLLPVEDGSSVFIELKSARKEIDVEVERLNEIAAMVESNPEIMRGTPVFKGTRIPVDSIASMLSQGASMEELLDGYPSLNRKHIEAAPLYVKAFPYKGRPPVHPWSHLKPRRIVRILLS